MAKSDSEIRSRIKWPALDEAAMVFTHCENLVPKKMEKGHSVTPIWSVDTAQEAGARLRQNIRLAEIERKGREFSQKQEAMERQIADLQKSLLDLSSRVAHENKGRAANKIAGDPVTDPRMLDVLKITREMFPGSVSIAVLSDPEEPNDEFIVLTVQCDSEDIPEIVRKRHEWHDRIENLPSGFSGHIRLSIC